MEATEAHIYARQLLETHGWTAIVAAAQRARSASATTMSSRPRLGGGSRRR